MTFLKGAVSMNGLFEDKHVRSTDLYDGPSVKENIFKYFYSPPYFGGRKYI